MEILKNLDSLQFTKTDFFDAWDRRKALLTPDDNPDYVMKEFFEFSIIGYYSPGGGGGGAEYVWKYKDPKSALNENAANFRVHPGFKEVLNLKKYTRSE